MRYACAKSVIRKVISKESIGLFTDFHSRGPTKTWESPWRAPRTLWAIGEAKTLYYSSNKKDPNDSKDHGGSWKGFYHEHEPETLIYCPLQLAREFLQGAKPLTKLEIEWPKELVWLGSADGFDIEINKELVEIELDGKKNFKGLQLWGFSDRKNLVAAPAEGPQNGELYVWSGPELSISWSGVEG